jgi:ATP-dependent RNA helicase RhlE
VVYPVDRHRQRELLSYLIRSGRIDRALVFTRTKHGANRLAEQLAHDGIDAVAIHGNKSQGQRIRALDDFKEGRAAILVATEVAARGLDIDGLPHVVNYELPTTPQDYIHRIGRTGRAGMEGDAVSLVCIDERDLLEDIERLLRGPIPWETVQGFEPDRRLLAEPIPELTRGGRSGRGRPARSSEGRPGRSTPRRRPQARPAPAHPSAQPHVAAHRPERPAAPVHAGAPRQFVALPGERFARSTAG